MPIIQKVRSWSKMATVSMNRMEAQKIVLMPRILFFLFLVISLLAFTIIPCQAKDIFEIAKDAMQSVYEDVAGIATVAAVVCAAACLFLMNFSKTGKTVDESRMWLKRIVICWVAIMTLGAIVTYMKDIIPKQDFSVG